MSSDERKSEKNTVKDFSEEARNREENPENIRQRPFRCPRNTSNSENASCSDCSIFTC